MNTKLDNIFFLTFFVLDAIAIFLILLGAIWIIITEKRLKKFFLGKKAKDLEETIITLGDDIAKLNKSRDNIEKEISKRHPLFSSDASNRAQ